MAYTCTIIIVRSVSCFTLLGRVSHLFDMCARCRFTCCDRCDPADYISEEGVCEDCDALCSQCVGPGSRNCTVCRDTRWKYTPHLVICSVIKYCRILAVAYLIIRMIHNTYLSACLLHLATIYLAHKYLLHELPSPAHTYTCTCTHHICIHIHTHTHLPHRFELQVDDLPELFLRTALDLNKLGMDW